MILQITQTSISNRISVHLQFSVNCVFNLLKAVLNGKL